MRRHALPALFARAVACVLVVAGPMSAQEHPIQFVVRSPRSAVSVRPGDTLGVVVSSSIPFGWHLYSLTQPPGGPIPTTVAVGPSSLARLDGNVHSPMPQIAPDPNFGIQSEWYEDSVAFRLPVRIVPFAAAGKQDLLVRIGYQTCNARYCLPPTEDTLRVGLTIATGSVATAAALNVENDKLSPPKSDAPGPTAVAAVEAPPVSHSGAQSFGLFLWLAATMGALSLLTPCVFPMVPITISYFSRGDRGSRTEAVRDAFMYAGGIVVAFTGIGVGLSVVMGVAGLNRFAANPLLNLAVGVMFIVFALSLFGVLQIAMPHRLATWLDGMSGGTRFGRVVTSLLMGVTFAVTTFTCTAPFVGTLLVSATQGDWRWPAAGLLAFSGVFSLPFLVLALVPHSLARLPKSGEWLATMKGALGFIELAASLKFLSNADLVAGWNVFTRQRVVFLWVVLAALLFVYLLGLRLEHFTVRRTGRWYRVASLGALAATVFVATGLTGGRLGELESFLPPAGRNATGVAARDELGWMVNDFDGGLKTARAQGKLVLIDFTGYTCTNCRWMEANMFPRTEISRALEQFVRVRLFTDGSGDLDRRQQLMERDKFRTVALPLYAIVDSLGQPRATFLGMTRDTKEFLEFLNSIKTDNR